MFVFIREGLRCKSGHKIIKENNPSVRQNDERLRILRTDEYYDELFAVEKTRSNADL
jgi:hypothetical protein